MLTTELFKENPYRYRHYYWDRKTQFYYLQARYYNPRLGRFISMDPWRGEVQSPLSLNRYVYTYNNPINYSDPSGLCVLCGDLKDLPVRDGTFEPVSVKAEIEKIGDTIYVVLKFPQTVSDSIVEMTIEDAKGFVKNYLISLDINKEYTDAEENAASRRLAEIYGQYYSGGAVSSLGTRIIRRASSQLVTETKIITQTAERKALNQVVDSEVPRMDLKVFGNKGNVIQSGTNALKNFNINNAYVKPKHLSTTGGNGAKFLGNSKAGAEAILKDVMQNGKIRDVLDNGLTKQGNQSYEIVIDAGKRVGTRGETAIKIVISEDGAMLTAYPVK